MRATQEEMDLSDISGSMSAERYVEKGEIRGKKRRRHSRKRGGGIEMRGGEKDRR